MNTEAVISEVKEFAIECVQKYREECLNVSDSIIENYLKTLMYPKDFEIFLRYKKIMLEEFRKTAQEELDFLNDKP
jgi:hypothetical protein